MRDITGFRDFQSSQTFLNEHDVTKLISLLREGGNAVLNNRIKMHTLL
jgi:hypothetical protein